MTRLFNAILAISSAASAFTTLPRQSSSSFVRTSRQHHGPLHMSRSMFGNNGNNNNDLPEETPEGSTMDYLLDDDDSHQFVTGDDLHVLRQEVLQLRAELLDDDRSTDSRRHLELQRAILKAQQMDAEFVYTVSLERMEADDARGRHVEAAQWRADAMEARAVLPQFNLDGLWVGKYGDAGYEMINVTYVGDKMYAYKVTGDQNVPKGELSFAVDLSPIKQNTKDTTNNLLEPVELGEVAAHQWGAKYLTRFAGKGQVAGEGHVNSQFIEGQLILVNEFFSFAWVPIGHQVFFGRPSAELTLKLMRAAEEANTSDIEKARAHLTRCMEETEHLQEDMAEGSIMASDDTTTIITTQQDYYGVAGYFE